MKKPITAAVLLIIVFALASCVSSPAGTTDPTKEPLPTEPASTEVPTDAPEETPVITEAPATEEVPTVSPVPTENVVYEKPAEADYTEKGTSCGEASMVCDGDETTRWSGFDLGRPNWSKNMTYWVKIDLQGKYVIKDFYINFESLTGTYFIQVSETGEDDSWTNVYEYDDAHLSPARLIDEGEFDEGTEASFIRILIQFPEDETFSGGYPYLSIYEFECNGYPVSSQEET